MSYSKKRMAVFGMQKREKITKVFSSNYISVIRRIGQYSGCAVRKITGLYKKHRKNRTIKHRRKRNKIIVCLIIKTCYICSAIQLGEAHIRY